uniref:Caspase domain-containing protein n=1 Tax=Candidatus Kentrum sp. FW TaxID=2126338 RepID=A0A450ST04_9GAMM|nr:MAG: Caspase domain-containing protein [Candidatus Kentron sp. FW]
MPQSTLPRNFAFLGGSLLFLFLVFSVSAWAYQDAGSGPLSDDEAKKLLIDKQSRDPNQGQSTKDSVLSDVCSFDDPIETDGYRRLALIVGVGEHKSEKIPDLEGPPNDARNFYELLTGKNGYGFPKENVCLLLDEQTTTAGFVEAFKRGLINRISSENDVAVFFHSGHGSQIKDTNGDEPDGWDESLLFHDSRTDGIKDFLDDEFAVLLGRLHEKTGNITVIVDSVSAGGIVDGHGVGKQDVIVRGFGVGSKTIGSHRKKPLPVDASEMVVCTAAAEGGLAMEHKGGGLFTKTLLKVLDDTGDKPLTYAQLAHRVRSQIADTHGDSQIPYFHGNLDKPVFGNTSHARPPGWDVTKLFGEETDIRAMEISGPPLPGIGLGTELRIYDGAATFADVRDPTKAKAVVVITETNGINATAKVEAISDKATRPEIGDLAILARPAEDMLKIRVRLRPANEEGGIDRERGQALRQAIESNDQTRMSVIVTNAAAEFDLGIDKTGRLVLHGPENRVRKTFHRDAHVPDNLRQHALQRTLLRLRGDEGRDFIDNETLQVQLEPREGANNNCLGPWEQAPPNSEQIVSPCHAWHVKVTLDQDSPVPLLISAVLLSADGGIHVLPKDRVQRRLQQGKSVTFGDTFIGLPPFDLPNHVLVFGTREQNPIRWHLLGDAARGGTVRQNLSSYLQPDTRGNRFFARIRSSVNQEPDCSPFNDCGTDRQRGLAFLPSSEALLGGFLSAILRSAKAGHEPIRILSPTAWTMSRLTVRVRAPHPRAAETR